MNTILLQPTDVLFFRDGRPMGGSLAGHGAAWPLPTVTDAALHAALHRSSIQGHGHDQRHGAERIAKDSRRFGSLVTAGPFPVSPKNIWYLPRPLDLTDDTLAPTLLPTPLGGSSSLPSPLRYAIAGSAAPTKDSPAKPWLSQDAYQHYLSDGTVTLEDPEALADSDFSDAESTIGIGIDSETQTQDGERIYSAHYLRLRDNWRLGLFAKTDEKQVPDPDLVPALFRDSGTIIVGGQQRVCSARIDSSNATLPLPRDRTNDFNREGRCLVKWVLLTPAVWPAIKDRDSDGKSILDKNGRVIEAHTGGWLPNWVRQSDGKVMLRAGERQRRSYSLKHSRGFDPSNSTEISAHLVAALVPKPIVVTGWALPNEAAERPEGGAKPTHLAVPAGAVYYFEAASEPDAKNLASALNWHGSGDGSDIKNRRSTLLGEKGFGLGVCGTWQFLGEKETA